jgi:hypothetical protein
MTKDLAIEFSTFAFCSSQCIENLPVSNDNGGSNSRFSAISKPPKDKSKEEEFSNSAGVEDANKCQINDNVRYYSDKKEVKRLQNLQGKKDRSRSASLVYHNITTCLAGVIFPIIAHCKYLPLCLSDSTNKEHDGFTLYYLFATIICSIIEDSHKKAVDPLPFVQCLTNNKSKLTNGQHKYIDSICILIHHITQILPLVHSHGTYYQKNLLISCGHVLKAMSMSYRNTVKTKAGLLMGMYFANLATTMCTSSSNYLVPGLGRCLSSVTNTQE